MTDIEWRVARLQAHAEWLDSQAMGQVGKFIREAAEALSLSVSVSRLPEEIASAMAGLAVIRDSTVRPELRDYARIAAAALERMAQENERLSRLTKCDSCGELFNENGGICEPCHSSALASHIRPLGARIRELEAERDAIQHNYNMLVEDTSE